MRGLAYNYSVRRHETQVELYIDRGEGADDENGAIFDALHAKKAAVEATFGGALDWMRLDKKRACRIRCIVNRGGWQDEAKFPEAIEATVDAMVRLEKALHGPIQQLKLA